MEKINLDLSGMAKYLSNEFLARVRKNPSYSLRSFANHLDIDHSSLSQIIRGKRNLSDEKAKELGQRLGLGLSEIKKISKDSKSSSSKHDKKKFKQLEEDKYDIAAYWYYYAILEMLSLDSFKMDPKWIASKLKLPVSEVTLALQKLIRSKYMYQDKQGNWINALNDTSTIEDIDFDHKIFRNLQRQLRAKAMESIDHQSPTEKSHTSYISVMDSSVIPEIKEEINHFYERISKLMEKQTKNRDSVGSLQISFFPIIKEKGE